VGQYRYSQYASSRDATLDIFKHGNIVETQSRGRVSFFSLSVISARNIRNDMSGDVGRHGETSTSARRNNEIVSLTHPKYPTAYRVCTVI
jgi:hypothetical protein